MCLVLKRLSTRKSTINSDLVTAQHAQLSAVKKDKTLVRSKQIFGPSYFVKALKLLTPPPPLFPVAKSNIAVPSPDSSSSKTDEFEIAVDELVTFFYSKVEKPRF